MKNKPPIEYYSPKEERLNVISHGIGLGLSVIALVFLILKALQDGGDYRLLCFTVFGLSLIVLYAASTFYHAAKNENARRKLNILDHAAIYVLIAGTYTPFTFLVLEGTTGLVIFCISWSLALIGIVLKLFFTGRFDIISTIAYVLMGWLIVFVIKPLVNNLEIEGVFWLFLGGFFYTTGAILYSIKKIKYNHALFHVFVLLGSFCHFITVYFYV